MGKIHQKHPLEAIRAIIIDYRILAMPHKRPSVLHGKTIKLKTGCGSIYLIMNRNETNQLKEISLRMGKAGTCKNLEFFLLGVVLSAWLQDGASMEQVKNTIKHQFIGMTCENPLHKEGQTFVTCYDILGEAMLKEIESIEKENQEVSRE